MIPIDPSYKKYVYHFCAFDGNVHVDDLIYRSYPPVTKDLWIEVREQIAKKWFPHCSPNQFIISSFTLIKSP